MNSFINTFEKLWQNDIKEHFQNGYITWEHQLQAHLYYLLKCTLDSKFEIWVEPVLYLKSFGLDKVRPDLVITYEDKIIAIIELKVKTWELPLFEGDIEKLKRFNKVPKVEKIAIWFIPFSNDWETQKKKGIKKEFTIDENFLKIFAIIGKPGSEVFTKIYDGIKIFKGYVDNKGEIIFK